MRPLLPFVLACLLAPAARAASYDAHLDVIEETSFEMSKRVEQLEAEAKPGSHVTAEDASARFDELLVRHLVGDHLAAAEGFFTLTSLGVLEQVGLHRDAEWYLGEALLSLENYGTAAAQFRKVVDDPDHPFQTDGVRRLLEIYARANQPEAFEALYEEQIVNGPVEPTPLVMYTLAKGYYQQGAHDRAIEHFARVPPDSDYGARSQYFLGTIAVVRSQLEQAAEHFEAVARRPFQTVEDRKVHDLAMLALARLRYHHGDYDGAVGFYDKVDGDSAFQAEKLYELVWSSIRGEYWQEALNHVEIFLLAFPDHRYNAQMKLLHGHLNVQQERWEPALATYDQVVDEYGPLRDRFADLARPQSDARPEIREVLEGLGGVSALPGFVVSMLRADPSLARAVDVYRDLAVERAQLDASEALIAELRVFMEQQGSVGPYAPLRLEALKRRSDVVRQRLELLGTQAAWVEAEMGSLPPELATLEERRRSLVATFTESSEAEVNQARAALFAFERRVAALRAEARELRATTQVDTQASNDLRARLDLTRDLESAERRSLEADLARRLSGLEKANVRLSEIEVSLASLEVPDVLATVDPTSSDALFTDLSQLVSEYAGMRGVVVELAQRGADIDAADTRLTDAYVRLGSVVDAASNAEEAEQRILRLRFDTLVAQVANLRAEHDRTQAHAQRVSDALTRDGFAALQAYFASSVERADVGIVDVHWAEKLGVADELAELRSEQRAVVDALEDRFGLIRKRMGREP